LGLVGFYRSFVPSFAQIAVALTDLTRKGAPNKLRWEAPQEHAFVSLRIHIAGKKVLRLPGYLE